jgi:hypothetical protein
MNAGAVAVARGCSLGVLLLGALASFASATSAAADSGRRRKPPIVLEDQGSFLVGGNVVTNPGAFDPVALTPDGQTIHGYSSH